jgi:hypothetical protein
MRPASDLTQSDAPKVLKSELHDQTDKEPADWPALSADTTSLLGVGLGGDNSPRMIAFKARLEFWTSLHRSFGSMKVVR